MKGFGSEKHNKQLLLYGNMYVCVLSPTSKVQGDGEANYSCTGDPAGDLQPGDHQTCRQGAAGGLYSIHARQQEGKKLLKTNEISYI